MNQEQKNKYERLAKITGIVIGLVLVLGISYAVFKTTTLSDKTNEISAGKLELRIDHEEDEILLENAVPITEEEGLKQSPYVFDVVNEGTIEAAYDLYIEVGESTTLPTSVVRYYLTVEEDNEEKIVTSRSRIIGQEEVVEKEGKKLYKIDRKYIDTNKTNKYKLYLWVDYEATVEEAANKYFEARVVIEGEQIYDKNRLVKQIDVSENGDNSVIAYMYTDGRVVLKGKGTIASNLSNTLVYEKEGVLDNYKKILLAMGCNEEEVNAITTIKELEVYQNNFSDEEWNNFDVMMYKEIFGELGYDTSGITDNDSLIQYMIEQGLTDEEGNLTEKGESFFEEFEQRSNEKYSTDPIAPSKIELEDGITNIPEGLFTGNEEISDVKIPNSVTSIANNAFYGCTGIKEIALPNAVTTIGNNAFRNCINMQKIKLSKNLKEIGGYSFMGCGAIKDIILPEGLIKINIGAFKDCTSLTELEIPSTVNSSGFGILENCSNLKKLTVDGTKGYSSFFAENIETLIIKGNGEMNDNTPYGSSKTTIKEIIIEEGITSIIKSAFERYTALNKIYLPSTLTNIETNSFAYCSNLKEINIPNQVINIGERAFMHCTSLTSVHLPEELQIISDSLFYNCQSLDKIELPETITEIGPSAFRDCKTLKSMEIPSSVTIIDYNTFSGCESLERVSIPNQLTAIGTSAFANCKNLMTLSIPKTVTEIGESAFNGCSKLDHIVLPNITTISHSLFANCSSLSTIKIPATVTMIESSAFAKCTKLTEIIIPETVEDMESGIITDCTSLKKLTISGTREYANLGCKNIEELVVTGKGNMYDHTYGGTRAPWDLSSKTIKKVTISKDITKIGAYSFQSCTAIQEITIPASVTSIGGSAFNGWTSSQTIHVDNTKEYVDTNFPNGWNASANVDYLKV